MTGAAADKSRPNIVSMGRLEELLGRPRGDILRVAAAAGRYYRPFDLRKDTDGGKWRHIDNPCGELKRYHDRIRRGILGDFPFPDNMFGAARGRSVKDNAQLHLRRPVVVALDLRDCFPRINDVRVYAVFRDVLGCSAEVSGILTKLTTFQHRLPQGRRRARPWRTCRCSTSTPTFPPSPGRTG